MAKFANMKTTGYSDFILKSTGNNKFTLKSAISSRLVHVIDLFPSKVKNSIRTCAKCSKRLQCLSMFAKYTNEIYQTKVLLHAFQR